MTLNERFYMLVVGLEKAFAKAKECWNGDKNPEASGKLVMSRYEETKTKEF